MNGRSIGRYTLVDRIGDSPTGSVWRAHDADLGRDVALKVLADHVRNDDRARRHLLREARLASKLDHPSIAAVLDAGEFEDVLFVAYRLVDGPTLESVVSEGPLDIARSVRIATELADALAHAHEQGILHCDVTSQNVRVEADGRAVLVDFGLAIPVDVTLASFEKTSMSSMASIAPEVLRGGEATVLSDQYALGAILYECLTGTMPFGGDDLMSVLEAVDAGVLVPPSRTIRGIPAALDDVVITALARDPESRFDNVRSFSDACRTLTPRPVVSSGPEVRRPRPRAGLVVGMVAVVASSALVWWIGAEDAGDGASEVRTAILLPLDAADSTATQESVIVDQFWREVTNSLHRIGSLRVKSYDSGFRAASRGDELGVLLAGRDEDLVLVAQMKLAEVRVYGNVSVYVDGEEAPRWIIHFDRPRSEFSELHAEILDGLAGRFGIDLESTRELRSVPSPSIEAAEALARGARLVQEQTRGAALEAEKAFREALDRTPGLPGAHVGLGAVYNQRSWYGWERGTENLELAIDQFERALTIDPGHLPAHEGIINARWYGGRSEACLQQGELVAATSRADVGALFVMGKAYMFGGLASRAAPFFERVLELDPDHEPAAWYRVPALAWIGESQRAIDAAAFYIQNHGDDAEIRLHMADAYDGLGNQVMARAVAERALELYEGNPNFVIVEAVPAYYQLLGDEIGYRDALVRCRELVEDIVRVFPESHQAHAALAYVCALQGDDQCFETEYEWTAPVYDTAFTYAKALVELDRPGEARALIREAWAHGHFNEMHLGYIRPDSYYFSPEFGPLLDEATGIHERLLSRYRFGLDRI